jgi:hypothetical protein
MVRPGRSAPSGQQAMLIMELAVALFLLGVVLVPLAYSWAREHALARAYYLRGLAMEIVDGEAEILAAGEWRAYQPGPQPYAVHGNAARNLPRGKFILTLSDRSARLQWTPDRPDQGGPVARTWKIEPAPAP